MKPLLMGIVFIVLVGFAGFFYRNALENTRHQIACPVEFRVCPDGTKLAHAGLTCDFPSCPPPNVSLASLNIAYAVPGELVATTPADKTVLAAYTLSTPTEERGMLTVRRYPINASSTALDTIKSTAILESSGLPASPSAYTSLALGNHNFTTVVVERFEGVVTVSYYLVRATEVLRFDATDKGVDWTNPGLDIAALPVQVAARRLLTTLVGE